MNLKNVSFIEGSRNILELTFDVFIPSNPSFENVGMNSVLKVDYPEFKDGIIQEYTKPYYFKVKQLDFIEGGFVVILTVKEYGYYNKFTKDIRNGKNTPYNVTNTLNRLEFELVTDETILNNLKKESTYC